MTELINITQALQSATNARSHKNTAAKYQSSWLTDYTQTWTASLDDLLSYAKSIGLEVTERTNTRTLQTVYEVNRNGEFTGLIDQPEYENEKALTPSGWLFIHVIR